MNQLQIKLEKLKKAAHQARFEPAGKPFKEACDLVEKLERVLRSISQNEDIALARQLAKEAIE
jgi:hypothetical protein